MNSPLPDHRRDGVAVLDTVPLARDRSMPGRCRGSARAAYDRLGFDGVGRGVLVTAGVRRGATMVGDRDGVRILGG